MRLEGHTEPGVKVTRRWSDLWSLHKVDCAELEASRVRHHQPSINRRPAYDASPSFDHPIQLQDAPSSINSEFVGSELNDMLRHSTVNALSKLFCG